MFKGKRYQKETFNKLKLFRIKIYGDKVKTYDSMNNFYKPIWLKGTNTKSDYEGKKYYNSKFIEADGAVIVSVGKMYEKYNIYTHNND